MGWGASFFCDLPDVDATTAAGKMVLSVMASVAEFEAGHIRERTKDALAAAKARGVKLGGLRPGTIKENARAKEQAAKQSERLRPILTAMTAQGASLRAMASALASAGTTTAKGLPLSPTGVGRYLELLGLAAG